MHSVLQFIAINVDDETGVEEARSVVNYEEDITHVHSVTGNYTPSRITRGCLAPSVHHCFLGSK